MAETSIVGMFNIRNLVKLENKQLCEELLSINLKTSEYGLELTPEQAAEIIETRGKALRENERIETGIGAISRIIDEFSKSSFITPGNYAETLNELLDTFYYVKTVTSDHISDTELISIMREFFEKSCGGSVELLQGRELERLIRYINNDRVEYQEDDEYEEPAGDEGDDEYGEYD